MKLDAVGAANMLKSSREFLDYAIDECDVARGLDDYKKLYK